MGVERAVTRWYVQRQIILDEIDSLKAKLAQQSQVDEEQAPANSESKAETETGIDLVRKLTEAQDRLITLGPCPQTKMG